MHHYIDDEKILEELKKRFDHAEKLLSDQDTLEKFLKRVEKKSKSISMAADALAELPIFVSLVRSYVNKEYTKIPLGSVIAVVSALIYLMSPVDLIPDIIPIIGHVDDALVIRTCWALVHTDVEAYIAWGLDKGDD